MATKLTTAVTRESSREYRPDGGGKLRPLMITLQPGDVLELKPKGLKRPPVRLEMGALYELAVRKAAPIGGK